ncbi:MAG: cell envelope integrity protein TolA [Bacteroidaceae bacterium]
MKRTILIFILTAIICLLCFSFYKREETLKASLAQKNQLLIHAADKEKEAVIVRRVSSQMEEITYQQMVTSDKRRQYAEQQRAVAETMRTQAEVQRGKAENATNEALKAFKEMQLERQVAIKRQREAELAKRQTDTLSIAALSRSLMVATDISSMNLELRELLTYAAGEFMKECGESYYKSYFYDRLYNMSSLQHDDRFMEGGIIKLIEMPDHRILAISNFGEVGTFKLKSFNITSKNILFSDPTYYFNSACYDSTDHLIYVIDNFGSLLVVPESCNTKADKLMRITKLSINKIIDIAYLNRQLYLLTKEGQCFCYNIGNKSLKCIGQSHFWTALKQDDHQILLGDKQGTVYGCTSDTTLKLIGLSNYKSAIVCFYPIKEKLIVGYADGSVQLLGSGFYYPHRAAIIGIAANHQLLVSMGYESHLHIQLLENPENDVSRHVFSSRILSLLLLNNNKELILADEHGCVYVSCLSPEIMISDLHRHLTRNLTHEEWNKYIGRQMNYRTFIDK